MGFDFNCLPPAMQQQALRKLQQQTRVSQAVSIVEPKENKFHNTPTESRGLRFQGKNEAKRYEQLLLLHKGGRISDLRLQVNFTLQEGYTTPEGKRIRPIVYKADFTYMQDGKLVVEDVKSVATKTDKYQIKKKMVQSKYGVEIKEVML